MWCSRQASATQHKHKKCSKEVTSKNTSYTYLNCSQFVLILVVPKKSLRDSRAHTPETPHFHKIFTTSPRKTRTREHCMTRISVILTIVLYWVTYTRACNCTVNDRGCIDTGQNTPELSPVFGPTKTKNNMIHYLFFGNYHCLSLK